MKKILFLIFAFITPLSACGQQNEIIINVHGDTLYPLYLGYNTNYKTQYYVLHATDSPVVVIDGGIHGDEVAGIAACDDLLRNIKITKGMLVIVPRLNRPACNKGMRTRQYEFERQYDLNRNFQGNTNRNLSNYEPHLADEFTALIRRLSPNLVLNLHEDKDLNENKRNRYDCEDHYLGQVLISCTGRCENFDGNAEITDTILLRAQSFINEGLHDDHKFTIINLPSAPEKGYSLDYFHEIMEIPSYTLETFRNGSFGTGIPVFSSGFDLDSRTKLQIITCLSFLKTFGVKYEYPGEDELKNLPAPVRYR